MSAISRRPPSDGGSGEAPVAPGYLLDERLPDSVAAAIASRLDEALRAQVFARRRLRFAAAIAVTSAAAAVVVGLFVARNPVTVAPARVPPPLPPVQAARPEPGPASPPVAKLESRSVPSPAAHPSPPVVAPPRSQEPDLRRDSRPAPTVAESEKPAPAVAEVLDRGLAGAVAPPPDEERTVRMSVRRTDDPRRAPIVMTIRYRRPANGASKEVPK